jgi:hypothetical protein
VNYTIANHHSGSNLQIPTQKMDRFCPKNRGFLQKNRGPTEIILHFFSCFFQFLGILPVANPCFSMTNANPTPPKKIVPETLP